MVGTGAVVAVAAGAAGGTETTAAGTERGAGARAGARVAVGGGAGTRVGAGAGFGAGFGATTTTACGGFWKGRDTAGFAVGFAVGCGPPQRMPHAAAGSAIHIAASNAQSIAPVPTIREHRIAPRFPPMLSLPPHLLSYTHLDDNTQSRARQQNGNSTPDMRIRPSAQSICAATDVIVQVQVCNFNG